MKSVLQVIGALFVLAVIGSALASTSHNGTMTSPTNVGGTTSTTITSTGSATNSPTPKPKPQMTQGQQNAVQSAQDYLSGQSFSKRGLISQLSSSSGEGYSKADSTFAVTHIHVDWNAEAVKSAKQYLSGQSFSKGALIDQLSSSAGEGFTPEQANYAVGKVYH